jgi:hypothetical protein
MEREKRERILNAFVEGRIKGAAGHASLGNRDAVGTALDIVSSFVRIVTPPLRPVNFELLTSKEKADVSALVGVLMSCSCTFRPAQDQPTSDYVTVPYRLDPCVTLCVPADCFVRWCCTHVPVAARHPPCAEKSSC